MDHRRVAHVESAFEKLEGGVEVSGLGVVHHEAQVATAPLWR